MSDHTFDQPTLDDFADWIGGHLERALEDFTRKLGKVQSEAAAHGHHRSSVTIKRTMEVAHEEFDKGIDAALGALKGAILKTQLDKHKLREITEQKLRSFADDIKVLSNADKMLHWAGPAKKLLNDKLAEFDTKINRVMRQFDVGFYDPVELEMPPSVTNTLQVEKIEGSAVALGSHHLIQNITTNTVNIDEARAAVAEFEAALQSESIPPKTMAEISSDLGTIKSQLDKPSGPSKTIIGEATKSLRHIIEGAIGGTLTQPVLTAARALWAALGLA